MLMCACEGESERRGRERAEIKGNMERKKTPNCFSTYVYS